MVSAKDSKKIVPILNKWITYLFVLVLGATQAQKNGSEDGLFSKFKKEYKYVKSKKYKGPTDVYAEPAPMQAVEDDGESYEENYLEYSEEDIQKSRSERKKSIQKSYGDGTISYDPNIEKPDPIEIPEEETEAKEPIKPFLSDAFWITFLVIVIVVSLGYVIFKIAKNRKPTVKISSPVELDEQNPARIPKTELELRLEKALLSEDYRECVRIYFTFILKELIRLRRIKWKKEYTNYEYVLQMMGKTGYDEFHESVRIYDLVWYGEYQIGRAEFLMLEHHLKANYNALIAENE